MPFIERECLLTEFVDHVSKRTDPAAALLATQIEKDVPIYEATAIRSKLSDPAYRQKVKEELAFVLQSGAGVFVIKNAFPDPTLIDDATEVFNTIIAAEHDKIGGGDHFANAGANDRVWNALEKLCLRAPEVFARYYANDMIALASEAWLGPAYQITSQINVVRPGGQAQQPHCDYHLGFQTAERASQYPAHVHQLSACLTLQGAIAHCDMPLESGPTKLLPFSQTYPAGYVAWRREDFKDYFEKHHIQLPLEKGDAIFFNPALFHAAGTNITHDISRTANLLQVSSAFGRAMEIVDRPKMSQTLLPVLQEFLKSGQMNMSAISNVIAASAEGYPFPVNLDIVPPADGLAPKSQQDLMLDALSNYQTLDQDSLSL